MAYINGKQIMNAVAIFGELDPEFSATSQNLVANSTIANNVTNALKGTASGERVTVNDVSPIEHIAKATVRGKNLANILTIKVESESNTTPYISNVSEGRITITTKSGYSGNGYKYSGLTLKTLCPQLVVGRTYIVNADSPATNKGIYLLEQKISWLFGNALTITEEMLNCSVGFYGLHTTGDGYGDCTISNIQIEEGNTATEYTPYVKPSTIKVTEETTGATYTPDDNGVCNVVSISPTMTLSTDTDGATIELEYNRDINAVIADLYSKLT